MAHDLLSRSRRLGSPTGTSARGSTRHVLIARGIQSRDGSRSQASLRAMDHGAEMFAAAADQAAPPVSRACPALPSERRSRARRRT